MSQVPWTWRMFRNISFAVRHRHLWLQVGRLITLNCERKKRAEQTRWRAAAQPPHPGWGACSLCWLEAPGCASSLAFCTCLLRARKYLPSGGATAFPPRLVDWLSQDPQCSQVGLFTGLRHGGRWAVRLCQSLQWVWWGKDAVHIENDRKPNIALCSVNHGSLCRKQYVSSFKNK